MTTNPLSPTERLEEPTISPSILDDILPKGNQNFLNLCQTVGGYERYRKILGDATYIALSFIYDHIWMGINDMYIDKNVPSPTYSKIINPFKDYIYSQSSTCCPNDYSRINGAIFNPSIPIPDINPRIAEHKIFNIPYSFLEIISAQDNYKEYSEILTTEVFSMDSYGESIFGGYNAHHEFVLSLAIGYFFYLIEIWSTTRKRPIQIRIVYFRDMATRFYTIAINRLLEIYCMELNGRSFQPYSFLQLIDITITSPIQYGGTLMNLDSDSSLMDLYDYYIDGGDNYFGEYE